MVSVSCRLNGSYHAACHYTLSRPNGNHILGRIRNNPLGFRSSSGCWIASFVRGIRHHYETKRQITRSNRNTLINATCLRHVRNTPIISSTTRLFFTHIIPIDLSRIPSFTTKLRHQQSLFVNSVAPPSSSSSSSLVLPLCHYQYQQIRTFVRRKKRQTAEKARARRSLAKRRGLPIYFQHHNEKKYKPVCLRTHIGRVLNKATRGERPMEYLINFVEEYRKYSIVLRKTIIMPFIRENFQSSAYEHLFLRILRGVTCDNNSTGMNGLSWMIQFRMDLMDVIYDKATELKTLDRRQKMMQLRLSKYDKIKKIIRKEMAMYIHELSSQPYPITIPATRLPQFLPAPSTHNTTAALSLKQKKQNKNKTRNRTTRSGTFSDNGISPSTTEQQNSAVATTESHDINDDKVQSPLYVLGHIRRIYYNDISVRLIHKWERADPTLKSKFLNPNTYVYGWYQTDDASTDPDVLIFVALQDRIPKSLHEINHGNDDDAATANVDTQRPLTVATFYGITILNPALEKIGLGENMIRPIIQQLLDDTSIPLTVTTFSTLLPLYRFRHWLLHNEFEDDISLLVVNDSAEDFNTLLREWECPKEQVLRRMKALLSRNHGTFQETLKDKPIVASAVNNLLLLAAASYLVRAKTPVVKWRCNPLEISTRYHVAHGASIHGIHVAANPTESGWAESFGLMTNHIYNLHTLESNQARYNKKFNSIEIHEAVLQHVPRARKLQMNKEQREKWIPIDPVRKKMIELSQNGKLFKVPLYGPPALGGQKKTFHQRLVPERVRPALMPPVVPKVGVSGLTVYVKPTTIASKTAAIPSYVTRTLKGNDKTAVEGRLRPPDRNGASYWPDDVEFSLPSMPVRQEKSRTKSASQRGNRKKTRAAWDS